jgi:hypothetical protein
MDADKRAFLRGIMATAAVAATTLPAIADTVPTIYGDGRRDDTAGLQALLDGKPFRIDGEVVTAAADCIIYGDFRISDTLEMGRSKSSLRYKSFEWIGKQTKPKSKSVYPHKSVTVGHFYHPLAVKAMAITQSNQLFEALREMRYAIPREQNPNP